MEPAAVSFNSFGRRGDSTQHRFHYRQKKAPPLLSTPPCFTLSPSPSPSPCYSPSPSPSTSADSDGFGGLKPPAGISNLHRFLQHTTLKVPAQFLSKTCIRGFSSQGLKDPVKSFFSLSDIWDSFDEWSAYGAGVPLVLNGKEAVTQYYVPYLSAIQLYTSSGSELASGNRRRLGDDSDSSEIDSTSETSSNDGEMDTSSWSSSDGDRSREGESLLFEYFESAAPSLRVPLFDKVKDLASDFPGIRTINSNQISESSWLSVAWYPIYRIPTGPTLKDLAACFLTYYSLSTFSAENSSFTSGMHSQCGNQILLNPFGLAGYKFRGPVWTAANSDRQRASLLHRSSDDWLKRLYVRHPDFDYFVSHSYPSY